MLDDWFIVFVTRDLEWVEASNYCAGLNQVRAHLADIWKMENLHGSLSCKTDFSSHVIWPETLSGHPLFEFTKLPQSLWNKITSLGASIVEKKLTPIVREHFNSSQPSC